MSKTIEYIKNLLEKIHKYLFGLPITRSQYKALKYINDNPTVKIDDLPFSKQTIIELIQIGAIQLNTKE